MTSNQRLRHERKHAAKMVSPECTSSPKEVPIAHTLQSAMCEAHVRVCTRRLISQSISKRYQECFDALSKIGLHPGEASCRLGSCNENGTCHIICKGSSRHRGALALGIGSFSFRHRELHDGRPCPVADNVSSKQAWSYTAAGSVELFTVIDGACKLNVNPHQCHGQKGKKAPKEDNNDPSCCLRASIVVVSTERKPLGQGYSCSESQKVI